MPDTVLRATHDGVLDIAGFKIPCANLDDGTRVLTQGGFLKAIGRSRTPKAGTGATVADVPTFLAAQNLKPFIDSDLLVSTKHVEYRDTRGRRGVGYQAEILPKICEIYLRARDAQTLLASQIKIAERCDLLMRGLAHIGIIALVDEATGFQEVRDRWALQKILEKWISKELLPWTKRFPDDFYEQMFRLKGWQYSPLSVKRPQIVGKYTNDIVYDRLEAGVLDELKRLTPKDERGRRKTHMHRWFTPDVGHPKLRDHLNGVIALMKAAANWDNFKRMLARVYPKKGATLEIRLDD